MPWLLKRTGTYSLLAVIFLAVFLLSGCDSNQAPNKPQVQKPVATPAEITTKPSEPTKESQAEPQGEIKQPSRDMYKVVNVVDGDTLDVDLNGKTERLRLIGIDTPETVDPRKEVQCFGTEASNKAKVVLGGKIVSLEADNTQGERDKYQRLLRYVYLEDGTSFNKLMIAEGYAHEYTYQSNPYKYQAAFKEAEKQARENKKGLWNPDACPTEFCGDNSCNNGETCSACSKDCGSCPIPPPLPNGYECNCSKTCAQMKCEEAQYQLNKCGCKQRDADKDGIACDSQCQ